MTPESDVYGLGATLYHAIGRRPPFSVDAPGALILRVNDMPAPPLRGLCRRCPQDVADLIHRMLAKAPSERPSVTEAREALGELRSRLYPDYPPDTPD